MGVPVGLDRCKIDAFNEGVLFMVGLPLGKTSNTSKGLTLKNGYRSAYFSLAVQTRGPSVWLVDKLTQR